MIHLKQLFNCGTPSSDLTLCLPPPPALPARPTASPPTPPPRTGRYCLHSLLIKVPTSLQCVPKPLRPHHPHRPHRPPSAPSARGRDFMMRTAGARIMSISGARRAQTSPGLPADAHDAGFWGAKMGMGGTTARWCTNSRCPHLAQPLNIWLTRLGDSRLNRSDNP